jgi:hypothetical protein
MREQTTDLIVSLDVVSPSTGEVIPVDGVKRIREKYYSIRELNFKGSIMNMAKYQSSLCKSSKDIEMFWDILFNVDKHNELRINISEFAKTTDYSRQRITKFLSDAVNIGFMKRISRGVYEVNPFVFKSKGATNKIIEENQKNWK